ncbi:hypothetical protein BKA56DRAFT_617370 [Ilyonectria sp. MPI-CAGE-AT-0026]|nr:hypothetical protein BKA56DRAFT_617370 [Ilyonectria sp. MPI-CAGE-AT-0026]
MAPRRFYAASTKAQLLSTVSHPVSGHPWKPDERASCKCLRTVQSCLTAVAEHCPGCETQIPLLGSAAHNRTVLLAFSTASAPCPKPHANISHKQTIQKPLLTQGAKEQTRAMTRRCNQAPSR